MCCCHSKGTYRDIFISAVMQMVFISECKSCEISNRMFFNMLSFFVFENKRWPGYDINIAK